MFTIKHVSTTSFDPSAHVDGSDIVLAFGRDLIVDLTRPQAERLHAILSDLLTMQTSAGD
ncbi:hypothetical protein BTZ20_2222 [Rhodococcus sp. MTM3W5.2]|uniref:hypothetical protein n=1 Tax=Rhodococcus sp. MTM3W5.2 TaxID=1805827 RepID=UPI00097981C2|nr:hypothetical protein [Rhodococcus sp. MTM3W5.2]AQA24022.1 hypothetical protein BTZ20_2222 [Rhodococcus sp. MTM3W5.2]